MPELYKRKPNTTCNICKKSIYRRPGILRENGGKAYCSQNCYGKSCRMEIACAICGKAILAGANKKTCSRACANIQRTGIKYTGSRLNDKVVSQKRLKVRLLQKRGEKCERCQFPIYGILEVHHKDRDHSNNSLTNLELLCPNCHATEHYVKK